VNGEAIYETDYWKTFGEGPTEVKEGHHSEGNNKDFTGQDIRFTQKGNKLYAIMMAWPADGNVVIRSLGKGNEFGSDLDITNVRLLGSDVNINYSHTNQGLDIKGLGQKKGDFAHVLEITI